MLDEDLTADLGSEYLPEAGRRIGGLVDDHGIAQIARDLTDAEKEIRDELEGKEKEEEGDGLSEDGARAFQVVRGDMFSRIHEPVVRITTKGIAFNNSCISKLPGVETVELLFNPVERMIVVRPCDPTHPNAIPWNAKHKSASPLCKTFYDSMGWEQDYAFRVPCQTVVNPLNPNETILAFDMDNYVGRTVCGKEEVVIARKEAENTEEEPDNARSYYYPPDEDEPQEIREMEEKFQQAVEKKRRASEHPFSGISRGFAALGRKHRETNGTC